MTPDQLKELERLSERWANDCPTQAEWVDVGRDVMDLLPEVLAHVKQLATERNAALKAFRDLDVAYFLLKCRCEEMQWLIRDMHNGDGEHSDADVENALKHLSTDCGKGYVPKSELDAANAKCAEMLDAIQFWNDMYPKELAKAEQEIAFCKKENDTHGANFHSGLRAGLISHDIFLSRLKHALSSDCGKGYHADSEWKLVVDALEQCVKQCDYMPAHDGLAHAERITGGAQ